MLTKSKPEVSIESPPTLNKNDPPSCSYAHVLKEKEQSDCIVIKPKANQNNNKTQDDIRSIINPYDMSLKINKIKNIQNGALLIQANR